MFFENPFGVWTGSSKEEEKKDFEALWNGSYNMTEDDMEIPMKGFLLKVINLD